MQNQFITRLSCIPFTPINLEENMWPHDSTLKYCKFSKWASPVSIILKTVSFYVSSWTSIFLKSIKKYTLLIMTVILKQVTDYNFYQIGYHYKKLLFWTWWQKSRPFFHNHSLWHTQIHTVSMGLKWAPDFAQQIVKDFSCNVSTSMILSYFPSSAFAW